MSTTHKDSRQNVVTKESSLKFAAAILNGTQESIKTLDSKRVKVLESLAKSVNENSNNDELCAMIGVNLANAYYSALKAKNKNRASSEAKDKLSASHAYAVYCAKQRAKYPDIKSETLESNWKAYQIEKANKAKARHDMMINNIIRPESIPTPKEKK